MFMSIHGLQPLMQNILEQYFWYGDSVFAPSAVSHVGVRAVPVWRQKELLFVSAALLAVCSLCKVVITNLIATLVTSQPSSSRLDSTWQHSRTQ